MNPKTNFMKKILVLPALLFFAFIANCCTVTTSVHNATCYYSCNGSASATPVGVPPYTYVWSPGGQTTQTITGLCRGTYTVTVTDALGCQASATATVGSYPDIILVMGSTPACFGTCDGSATAQVVSGMGSFTYLWSPGGQTTQSISNQCAGTYTCTVTNELGCTKAGTVTIEQNPLIAANPSHTDLTCFTNCNGTANVSPSGGTSPYTYVWSPGGQTTSGITGQCAGTFTCTITDAGGCTVAAPITINSPVQLSTAISPVHPTCGSCNGSLQASVSGGVTPYAYSWSPGGQTTASISNQCSGNYTLTVTDANACSVSSTIALINLDAGSLDLNFSGDGKVTTTIGTRPDLLNSVAIQPDGKIVVAGYGFVDWTTQDDFAVVRYNSDGTLDNTFSGDGIQTTIIGNGHDEAESVAIQSDGKIVVGGFSVTLGFVIVRYNSDGSLDNSFDGDGIVTTDIGGNGRSVVIQPDGKIILAGEKSTGEVNDFAIVRYNSDGSLDNTFSDDGIQITDFENGVDRGWSVALQSDGKIVMVGASSNGGYKFAVVRYNSDGSLDNTFSGDGKLTTAIYDDARAEEVKLQSDGKIVVAGDAYDTGTGNNDFAVVRYNSDGSLDNTFDGDGIATTDITDVDFCRSVAIQSDGKIVLAGFSSDLQTEFSLVRCNSDGSLDLSFDDDGKVTTTFGNADDRCFSVAIQADGQIVAAGMTQGESSIDFAVARYVGCSGQGFRLSGGQSPETKGMLTPATFIYPNPSNGSFSINSEEPISAIDIVNALGEKVYSFNQPVDGGVSGISVDLSAHAAGIYFIRLKTSIGVTNHKLIIQ
jgi:uncharacterized delta-60 repeat protein